MPHHSFEKTLTYDDDLGDWFSNAATMALRDRVQILPPVPDRHGIFWHKKAIATRDFEITFTLSFYENKGPQDSALIFWLSPQNASLNYSEQTPPSHDYRGLAIVMLGQDKGGAKRQTVSTIWNIDEKRHQLLSPKVVFSEELKAQTRDVDWLSAGTQFKVRVHSDGSSIGHVLILDIFGHLAGSVWGWASKGDAIDGQLTFDQDMTLRWNGGNKQGEWQVDPGNRLKLEFNGRTHWMHLEGSHHAISDELVDGHHPTMVYGGQVNTGHDEWMELFRFPGLGSLPPDLGTWSVGFSGWSGSQTYIEANLNRFEMENYDPTTVGEEDEDILGRNAGEWLKVLDSEKRFMSQASQREAIVRLTKLLSDHVDEYDTLGENLKQEIVRLDQRLEGLSSALATGLTMGQAWNPETRTFNTKVIKEHILGVRTVLNKGKEHDAKLHIVSQAAQDLKAAHSSTGLTESGKQKVQSVAEQSRALEEHAAKGSFQTNIMLLVMVLSVGALGLLFLTRMRYYEKKHYI